MNRYRFLYCVAVKPSPDPMEKKGGFCKGCLDIEAETEDRALKEAEKQTTEIHPNRLKGAAYDAFLKDSRTYKRNFFKLMGVEKLPDPETPASCC